MVACGFDMDVLKLRIAQHFNLDSFEELQVFLTSAVLSKVVYQVEQPDIISHVYDFMASVFPPGWVETVTLQLVDHKKYKHKFLVAESSTSVYVALPGTLRMDDVRQDIKHQLVPMWPDFNEEGWKEPPLVHQGFYNRFKHLPLLKIHSHASNQGKQFILTGHSLGGAIALLGAIHLNYVTHTHHVARDLLASGRRALGVLGGGMARGARLVRHNMVSKGTEWGACGNTRALGQQWAGQGASCGGWYERGVGAGGLGGQEGAQNQRMRTSTSSQIQNMSDVYESAMGGLRVGRGRGVCVKCIAFGNPVVGDNTMERYVKCRGWEKLLKSYWLPGDKVIRLVSQLLLGDDVSKSPSSNVSNSSASSTHGCTDTAAWQDSQPSHVPTQELVGGKLEAESGDSKNETTDNSKDCLNFTFSGSILSNFQGSSCDDSVESEEGAERAAEFGREWGDLGAGRAASAWSYVGDADKDHSDTYRSGWGGKDDGRTGEWSRCQDGSVSNGPKNGCLTVGRDCLRQKRSLDQGVPVTTGNSSKIDEISARISLIQKSSMLLKRYRAEYRPGASQRNGQSCKQVYETGCFGGRYLQKEEMEMNTAEAQISSKDMSTCTKSYKNKQKQQLNENDAASSQNIEYMYEQLNPKKLRLFSSQIQHSFTADKLNRFLNQNLNLDNQTDNIQAVRSGLDRSPSLQVKSEYSDRVTDNIQHTFSSPDFVTSCKGFQFARTQYNSSEPLSQSVSDSFQEDNILQLPGQQQLNKPVEAQLKGIKAVSGMNCEHGRKELLQISRQIHVSQLKNVNQCSKIFKLRKRNIAMPGIALFKYGVAGEVIQLNEVLNKNIRYLKIDKERNISMEDLIHSRQNVSSSNGKKKPIRMAPYMRQNTTGCSTSMKQLKGKINNNQSSKKPLFGSLKSQNLSCKHLEELSQHQYSEKSSKLSFGMSHKQLRYVYQIKNMVLSLIEEQLKLIELQITSMDKSDNCEESSVNHQQRKEENVRMLKYEPSYQWLQETKEYLQVQNSYNDSTPLESRCNINRKLLWWLEDGIRDLYYTTHSKVRGSTSNRIKLALKNVKKSTEGVVYQQQLASIAVQERKNIKRQGIK